MRKTGIRVVIILVVGAVLALGIVAYKSSERAQMGRQLLGEFKEDLARAGLDERGKGYAEGLADECHERAYESSFGPNPPMLGGTANVTEYQKALIGLMIEQAKKDGSAEVAKALEGYRDMESTLDLSGHR